MFALERLAGEVGTEHSVACAAPVHGRQAAPCAADLRT
jgi:hypothetical protein